MNRNYIFLYTVLFTLTACHHNRWKVDLAGKEVKVEIQRLDQDLFGTGVKGQRLSINQLLEKYDDFFEIYNREIIAIGSSVDSGYPDYLHSFLTDSVVAQAKSKSDEVFKDVKWLEKSLSNAFSYYHFHFPDKQIPKIYSFISGFNQTIVTTPTAAGISLDNYLGENFHAYRMLAIPEYKRRNKYPEKIPYDLILGWTTHQFEFNDTRQDLISTMIYQGKLMCILDALFPDSADSIKIGFQQKQLDWVVGNESAMWTFLIEKKMLFSNDRMNIVRFIQPAPYTSAFSKESPGRTGIWLGWQIVRKYLNQHPEITLAQLMNNNDARQILNESNYVP